MVRLEVIHSFVGHMAQTPQEIVEETEKLRLAACCNFVGSVPLGGGKKEINDPSRLNNPGVCIWNGFETLLIPQQGYPVAMSGPMGLHKPPQHLLPGVLFSLPSYVFAFLQWYYNAEVKGNDIATWPIWQYNRALYGGKVVPFDQKAFIELVRGRRSNGGDDKLTGINFTGELGYHRAAAAIACGDMYKRYSETIEQLLPHPGLVTVDISYWLELKGKSVPSKKAIGKKRLREICEQEESAMTNFVKKRKQPEEQNDDIC